VGCLFNLVTISFAVQKLVSFMQVRVVYSPWLTRFYLNLEIILYTRITDLNKT
jgi:hypothetical protein